MLRDGRSYYLVSPRSLVRALRLTLTPQERALIARGGTSNAEAYDLYLRGREAHLTHIPTPGDEAGLRKKLAANPADFDARLALAGAYAGKKRYREALDELLEIVRRQRDWNDGAARKQVLNIFNLAGDQPELVSEYRRKLASALY